MFEVNMFPTRAKAQTQARLTPERGSYPLPPSLKTGGLGGRGATSPGWGEGAQSPWRGGVWGGAGWGEEAKENLSVSPGSSSPSCLNSYGTAVPTFLPFTLEARVVALVSCPTPRSQVPGR